MCLCSKMNKLYSAEGLYQGRTTPYANVKQASSQGMYKKISNSSVKRIK